MTVIEAEGRFPGPTVLQPSFADIWTELSETDRMLIFPLLQGEDRRAVLDASKALFDTRERAERVQALSIAAEEQIEAREEARRRLREKREAQLASEAGMAEAAAAFEAEIIDLDDLDDPEPLIDGFLHKDSLVRTFGPPKSLKSFVTLDMAACISLGIEWQGHRTQQASVLYIVAEGVRGLKKRRAAWNEAHGTEMKVIFYPKPVQIADPDQMHRLIAFCRIKQIEYVVFDTQARCTVGVEENDNTEMGEIVSALDILKQQTGACVHLVHHSGGSTPSRARGATAFDGAVDAEFYTERKGTDVTLVTKFQKDISEADNLDLSIREVGASLVLERGASVTPIPVDEPEAPLVLPDVTDKQMVYLKGISFYERDSVSPAGLAAKLKEEGHKTSGPNVRNKLIELKRKGLTENDPRERARWMITPLGVSVIAQHERNRAATESAWTSRSKIKRRPKDPSGDGQEIVSGIVLDLPAKLSSEDEKTTRNVSSKLSLTCDETKNPPDETIQAKP